MEQSKLQGRGKKYRERERGIQKPNVGKLKACLPDNWHCDRFRRPVRLLTRHMVASITGNSFIRDDSLSEYPPGGGGGDPNPGLQFEGIKRRQSKSNPIDHKFGDLRSTTHYRFERIWKLLYQKNHGWMSSSQAPPEPRRERHTDLGRARQAGAAVRRRSARKWASSQRAGGRRRRGHAAGTAPAASRERPGCHGPWWAGRFWKREACGVIGLGWLGDVIGSRSFFEVLLG